MNYWQYMENPWLAAFIRYQQGQFDHAIQWARLAVAMGIDAPGSLAHRRIGFRYWPALREAPYDILRFAYRALGMTTEAAEAERRYHALKAKV